MQNAPDDSVDEWAMSDRRKRAVMRDIAEPPRRKRSEEGFRFPTARGVLSKAEIEALLRPNLSQINDDEPVDEVQPVSFDAHTSSPPAGPDEQSRRIAARLSLAFGHIAGLKTAIRASSSENDVSVASKVGSSDGIMAFACFAPPDGDIAHVLALTGSLADRLVSYACGGRHDMRSSPRPLSAIDCALLEQLLGPLSKAFAPDCNLSCIETDAQYAASLMPADRGQLRRFDVSFSGEATEICLYSLTGPLQAAEASRASAQTRPLTALLTARIATLSVPVSKLSTMKPGDTLMLGLPADQPVELLSGGRDGVPAFEGDIGRKGPHMAIRVRRAID